MKLRPYLLFVAILGCFVGESFSQDVHNIMDHTSSFENLTPENLQGKIQGYIEQAENAQTDAEKGRIYSFLTEAVGSRVSDSKSQDIIIGLADKAISFDLSPQNALRTYWHRGTAIRKQYRQATGDDLRKPRRDIAISLLKGYKQGLQEVRSFQEIHMNCDPNSPPPEPTILPRGPITPGGSKELRERRGDWARLVENYRAIESIKHDIFGIEDDIVDVYARPPYDLAELRNLVLDILGEEEIANRLVADAKKEITAREKKKSERDFEILEEEVLQGALDLPSESLVEPADDVSLAVDGLHKIDEPLPAHGESRPVFVWVIILGVLLLIGIGGTIVWQRKRRS